MRRISRREYILGFVCLAGLWFVLAPVLFRPHESGGGQSCVGQLKQIELGFLQYRQDYNEKMPPAATKSGGWANCIFPYVKSTRIFHCRNLLPPNHSAMVQSNKPTQPGFTDYFYNGNLPGFDTSKMDDQSNVFNLVEGNDGLDRTDGNYAKKQLPAEWLTDQTSPLFRHLGGANYGFVDGHAKWIDTSRLISVSGTDSYYFTPKKVE